MGICNVAQSLHYLGRSKSSWSNLVLGLWVGTGRDFSRPRGLFGRSALLRALTLSILLGLRPNPTRRSLGSA